MNQFFSFTSACITQDISYSIGSSSVIIFLSLVFNFDNIVYKVVVLPDHVGHVTSIIPFFFSKLFSIILFAVQKNQSSSKLTILFFESSILHTAFSQYFVGSIETLISSFLSSIFIEYFQS